MNFPEAEQIYLNLKNQLLSGVISQQEFRNRVNELRVLDVNGVWWQIREEDGGWLRWTGTAWVSDTLPYPPPAQHPSMPQPAQPAYPQMQQPQSYPPQAPGYGAPAPQPAPSYNQPVQPPPAQYAPQPPMQQQAPPMQYSGQRKNEVIAAVASIWPGLGQAYVGELGRGLAIFAFVSVLSSLGALLGYLSWAAFIVWAYGIYDSYSIAKKMNSGAIPFVETNTMKMVGLIIGSLIIGFVVYIIVSYIVALLLFSTF